MFKIEYKGFLQEIKREFGTREKAEQWLRQIGKPELIKDIEEVTAQFKRYYNDDGILQYSIGQELLDEIDIAMETIAPKARWHNKTVEREFYYHFINVGAEVIQSLQISSSMAGLGGAKSIDELRESNEASDFEIVLR